VKLHLVGGFLGSGKTTAIAAAAKHLMAQGKRVGIVTNDQGRYLVDTAFFRSLNMPAVEVTGGCFCCNYNDLDARLSQLQAQAQPDVIFAESVGSCTDIIATVVKPLLQLNQTPATLSVFVDCRLLERRLAGLALPFTEDVVYIFDKQLEEAGLIVVNKVDLLDLPAREALAAQVEQHFAGKRVLMQNTLDANDIATWVDVLESGALPPPQTSLDIDYARYGAGEADLAWLDAEFDFVLPNDQGRQVIQTFLAALTHELRAAGSPIGHLKLMVSDGIEQAKISLTSADDAAAQLPALRGTQVAIVLNIRAQLEADRLEAITQRALKLAMQGVPLAHWDAQHFHPGFPRPTHRLA
jgi:Ni2+-binding GTPase involved in maturation of urease and hydrogenase